MLQIKKKPHKTTIKMIITKYNISSKHHMNNYLQKQLYLTHQIPHGYFQEMDGTKYYNRYHIHGIFVHILYDYA